MSEEGAGMGRFGEIELSYGGIFEARGWLNESCARGITAGSLA